MSVTPTVFPVYEGLTREVLLDTLMHDKHIDRRARLVATVIAWHYDPDTYGTVMSRASLSEHLDVAFNTVKVGVELMVKSGSWLIVERYEASGGRAPHLYVPLFPKGLPDGVSIRGYATTEVTEAGTVIRLLPTEATPAVQVGGE